MGLRRRSNLSPESVWISFGPASYLLVIHDPHSDRVSGLVGFLPAGRAATHARICTITLFVVYWTTKGLTVDGELEFGSGEDA